MIDITRDGSSSSRKAIWRSTRFLGGTGSAALRYRRGITGQLSRVAAFNRLIWLQVARYGINSQISALAYDPVQSLLAVGTNDTQFGGGQVYVFGQSRVSVVLPLPRKSSVKSIHFVTDKLVCLDSKNEISVFSLETSRILSTYTPPGSVTALLTDPTLDFALVGLQNGV